MVAKTGASTRRVNGRPKCFGTRSINSTRVSAQTATDGTNSTRLRRPRVTLVEINLHREFEFEDGAFLDYRIAGEEVDCKYSQRLGGWMVPPEAQGYLCLLVWANDEAAQWSMGIVRVTVGLLNTGDNRDRKATLNLPGREQILWIFDHAAFPPNILLQFPGKRSSDSGACDTAPSASTSLFGRHLACVWDGVIATDAQQADYMKHVRAAGGARTALKPKGIVILGQYRSQQMCRAPGVVVPGPGESVAVRLAPADAPGPRDTKTDGRHWRVSAHMAR